MTSSQPQKARLISCMPFAENLVLFVRGARPQTLLAVLIPVLTANGLAFHQTGRLNLWIMLLTALSGLCIQAGVNFFNDAYDFKTGADSQGRKGPPRLTASGKKSFSQVRGWGRLSCFFACLLGAPLVLRGGWGILILGLISCAMAWRYSAGHFSLLKLGLSEFVCFLFFGPLAVFGSYWLQTLSWNDHTIYLGIQCGLQAVSLLLINYLRDEEEDRRAGRKHLVTVFSRSHGLLFLVAGQAVAYLLCFYWMGSSGTEKAGAFSFFVLPFASVLMYKVCASPPSSKYNLYLALTALAYTLFGGAWAVGLLL